MAWKVYRCDICGRVLPTLEDGDAPICCNQPMQLLVAGTTDAAVEKHVPVYEVNGNAVSVTVGSVEHPMIEEHYIEWIALETTSGCQMKKLKAGDAPKAEFALAAGEEVKGVYAYCNLHGLWKA